MVHGEILEGRNEGEYFDLYLTCNEDMIAGCYGDMSTSCDDGPKDTGSGPAKCHLTIWGDDDNSILMDFECEDPVHPERSVPYIIKHCKLLTEGTSSC